MGTPSVEDPVERLVLAGRAYLGLARGRSALFDLMTRHDLLESSGADLRIASLDATAYLHRLVVVARPGARSEDSLLLFATVHGLATLHARRAPEAPSRDPNALLEHLLNARWGTPHPPEAWHRTSLDPRSHPVRSHLLADGPVGPGI